MRRYLSLFFLYFIQYAKVRLAYRWDFLISLITMAAATFFGIALVFLIFSKIPRLLGWSFYEILFFYGFSLLPLSLFNTISINLYYFGENYIVQGKFDRVLLRPVNSLFQILSEQFRLEALGDTVLGVVLLVTCAAKLNLTLGFTDWLFIAAAAVCGSLIYVSVFLMLTAVSFWMEDRVGIIPPVYNLITFGRYPMDIYSGFIRFLLSWIVPFGFASFYPGAYLLRQDVYLSYVFVLPMITAVFMLLAFFVWERGVRNYSSTGS